MRECVKFLCKTCSICSFTSLLDHPLSLVCFAEVNYTPEAMKNSRNSVITQLGGVWLFLEDCPTQYQNKYFPDMIEQAVEAWQDANLLSDAPKRKPMKEMSKPQIVQIDGSYYFVAGAEEVHMLNHKKTPDDVFSRKLSKDEIQNLSLEIIWTGSTKYKYENDEKEAFKLLGEIFEKMNLMQDPKFYSFPLGSIYKFTKLQVVTT